MTALRTSNQRHRKAVEGWRPPADLDPECLELCQALNRLPGIRTHESCCGHGERPYRIWLTAATLHALPELCYCIDQCHSGVKDWRLIARTDCGMAPVHFLLEGPAADYAGAETIAGVIREGRR